MNKPVCTLLGQLSKNFFLHFFLLAISVLCVYGHTLNAPFYLDDYPSIVDNLIIHQLNIKNIWIYAPFRCVTYISFALNYFVHQLDFFGYHLVNIFIHFFVGCGIYYFISVLIRIPKINASISKEIQDWLPFLSALIFVIHPLHTQAVTYIVQRLSSLAALFYIFSIAFYIHARLGHNSYFKKYILFSNAMLFAVLALFTKENTVTLMLIIPCIELAFYQKSTSSRLMIMGSILITISAFWMLYASIRNINPFSLIDLNVFTRLGTDILRTTYFFTQLKIIWIYIRLFFVPIGLHLDYDISPAIADWSFFLAFICHILVIACAFYMRRTKPIIFLSVLFYYISHLIESSIFPIKDLCFEHRAYLPDIGLSLLCSYIIMDIIVKCHKIVFRYTLIGMLTVLLLVSGLMTWHRNHVWNNPISLWRDCSVYSPHKTRVWAELGKHLMIAEQNNEAIAVLNKVLKHSVDSSGHLKLNVQVICNLIILHHKKGDSEKAIYLANQILQYPINDLYRFYILNNKGNIYLEKKDFAQAETSYRQAISCYPNHEMAISGLYHALLLQEKIEEAHQLISSYPHLLINKKKKK
ncbi:conserved hypothetical protein, membrane [Candidatus Magnetomorum sp. HK-1]|nr:conserved hypothetical protein, membrane [Candidatus Magnetomorum sp. HK-1]